MTIRNRCLEPTDDSSFIFQSNILPIQSLDTRKIVHKNSFATFLRSPDNLLKNSALFAQILCAQVDSAQSLSSARV